MAHSKKDDDVAIRVSHVKKDFYLPHEKRSRSFKSAIISAFKKKDKGANTQHALKDISFEIKKGEFFGIVGRNGSGKSTLLKIIAQIYQPTSGKVEHFGKLVPFIELGVGFNPELSGKENVYLNGALLGFTREEIEEKYDDIVEFAELDGFMDQKLKNYSSGMQVRLAFSVAIQADADILVLDEVLAVGDEAFQRKCNDYFAKIRQKEGKTVVLVTHNMDAVRKYCNRAMMIYDGKIIAIGSPEDVANEYSLENMKTCALTSSDKKGDKRHETSPVKDFKVELLSPKQIIQGDDIRIRVSYWVETTDTLSTFAELTEIDKNAYLTNARTKYKKFISGERVSVEFRFNVSALNNSTLSIAVSVYRGDNKNNEIVYYQPNEQNVRCQIRRDSASNSILFERGKAEYEN